jgi:hypothetical protein
MNTGVNGRSSDVIERDPQAACSTAVGLQQVQVPFVPFHSARIIMKKNEELNDISTDKGFMIRTQTFF